MLFWMRLAKNIFSQPCKRYDHSKLNGKNPKIINNHHSCNLAFFNQNSYLLLVFWLKSSSYNIIWPKKLIFWIFVIFYDHLHQGVIFGQFGHLAPTPWVTPPNHPLDHLPLCFLCPTSPKNILNHENLTYFAFFKVGGWVINFGLFWPFLANFECAERSEGN